MGEAGRIPEIKIVDLSIPIDEKTPFYPGDPEPSVCLASRIAVDGFNVSKLELGSHTGTHCDAPYHFLEDGKKIDELPLSHFVGAASLIDVRGIAGEISWQEIKTRISETGLERRVLIHTGWSEHRGKERYFDHPYLSGEACRELVERGAILIGIDAINIDRTPPDGVVDRENFPCHQILSQAEGIIIENLTGLDQLSGNKTYISALPLNLVGSDGSPARVVAFEVAR